MTSDHESDPSITQDALAAQNFELSALLGDNYPVPELNIERLALRLQGLRETPPHTGGHKTSAPSRFENWRTGFYRPALAAAVLLALGFYLGFSEPTALRPLLNDEESPFDTVSQLAFQDNSLNDYLSYSQAFLRADAAADSAEQDTR